MLIFHVQLNLSSFMRKLQNSIKDTCVSMHACAYVHTFHTLDHGCAVILYRYIFNYNMFTNIGQIMHFTVETCL